MSNARASEAVVIAASVVHACSARDRRSPRRVGVLPSGGARDLRFDQLTQQVRTLRANEAVRCSAGSAHERFAFGWAGASCRDGAQPERHR